MIGARKVDSSGWSKNTAMHVVMGDWVAGLAPWQVVAHMTFSWEASVWSAQRVYERWMMKKHPYGNLGWVSYFYALEMNPGRDGFHVHALWADCLHIVRKEPWADWFRRYGRNRIEPVTCKDDVADYVAKYVTKEGAWWNVHLRGQRYLALKK